MFNPANVTVTFEETDGSALLCGGDISQTWR